MTLSPQDSNAFFNAMLNLLFFAGHKEGLVNKNTSLLQFIKGKQEVKVKCWNAIKNNMNLLDEFLASANEILVESQIELLKGIHKKIEGDFVILRCLKNYAIFINTETNKVYAVKALQEPFDSFFDYYPVMINTNIFPYKDFIVYDGFFSTYNVSFGANVKSDLENIYRTAKLKKEIITRLN
jgi:hypothetical protein